MREKELRLALVCYGGISLAVYMHGITREVWHLARSARGLAESPVERVYARLLDAVADEADLRLHILVDILAGASAGGLNAIFLGQAIATGGSLDPLTELWLTRADIDALLDPAARPGSRVAKMWAMPIAWAAGRELAAEPGEEATGVEVRGKLAGLVRSRWFAPPFDGPGFTATILDALDAIADRPCGPPLLPEGQPLDLIVTVTDFTGHPERLRLHSPALVSETEHRLTIAFTDRGRGARRLAEPAALAFAGRATASFPGAFPPFAVAELDAVLAARGQDWPGREAFLARAFPGRDPHAAVLIDGSVLANAPFRPAIDALRNRPAAREIDRRFVYLDPHPGKRAVRLSGWEGGAPGFLATLLGALSDIPRTQPIRDALDVIARRSERIEGIAATVATIAPEVERAVEDALGSTFLLRAPTAARLAAWRQRAHDRAARAAGFAYAAYAHVKLAGIVDEIAVLLAALAGPDAATADAIRTALAAALAPAPGEIGADRVSARFVDLFRAHDLRFRIRRLRFLAQRIATLEHEGALTPEQAEPLRDAVYAALAPFLALATEDEYDAAVRAAARVAVAAPAEALARLAVARDLTARDAECDERLAAAFAPLARATRRPLLFAWLGYPFYDAATLPLAGGESLDEFGPVKVDRVSPDDVTAFAGLQGGLKGVRFHGFGAFFSRAWREHDYLWGRLNGVERLFAIVASTLPPGRGIDPATLAALRHDAFVAVLAEERPRLVRSAALIDRIAAALGVAQPAPIA